MGTIKTIGLGGGCHWCTEAVYQSLRGVEVVEQGYISAVAPQDSLSEAVIVHYDPAVISLEVLIEIHLYTHKSTSLHSMRDTYRSAVYVKDKVEYAFAKTSLKQLESQFDAPIITQVLYFDRFKASREEILNYYQKDPAKPFCERYIEPKLDLLREEFGGYVRGKI